MFDKQFIGSKKIPLIFLLSSLFALALAYIAQYVFAIIPCKLCFYERIPYFVVILLSFLSLFKTHRIITYMMFCSYLAGVVISFYHVGLEFHWFSDILGCTEKVNFDNLSLDEMKSNLLDPSRITSCSRPEFMFLGISMAGWNLIYSVFWLIVGLYLNKIYDREKRKSE